MASDRSQRCPKCMAGNADRATSCRVCGTEFGVERHTVRRVVFRGKVLGGGGLLSGGKCALFVESDRVHVESDSRTVARYDVAPTDVRYIAVEDGGTKTNVAAVAFFGVFGLGARRQWTIVTGGFPADDIVLAIREPVQVIRRKLVQVAAIAPELEGRLHNGPPPPPSTDLKEGADKTDHAPGSGSAAEPKDTIAKLERLVVLRDEGAIDDDEFARLKSALIAREL